VRHAPRTLALALLVAAMATLPAAAGPDADVVAPPPFDQFLILPLRVHVLRSSDFPEIDCRLTDDDIRRILGKVNGIWNKAGLHWAAEPVVREPAAGLTKFRLLRDLDALGNLAAYRVLFPEESREFDGLHVYYLHRFPVNGVWLGRGSAVVQETAKLRPVEGGIDEPVPRVTAHELGHALGLPHRQDRTNLLASGTTGTLLNAREVETARATARTLPGVKTAADLIKEANRAEAAGDLPTARTLWGRIGEIPGGGDQARANLRRLNDGGAS